jgi:hypothetical protein
LLHTGSSKQSAVTANTGICDSFSEYFISKIDLLRQNIACKLSDCQLSQPLPPEPTHAGPLLDTVPPVTPNEVSRHLTSLPSKSSNLGYVPTSLIKTCHPIFYELIAKLATLSFQEGCFPCSFKTFVITPLIKKPNLDSSNLSNYRPISNPNNISKILEKLFLTRLQSHILASRNFNPH